MEISENAIRTFVNYIIDPAISRMTAKRVITENFSVIDKRNGLPYLVVKNNVDKVRQVFNIFTTSGYGVMIQNTKSYKEKVFLFKRAVFDYRLRPLLIVSKAQDKNIYNFSHKILSDTKGWFAFIFRKYIIPYVACRDATTIMSEANLMTISEGACGFGELEFNNDLQKADIVGGMIKLNGLTA